MKRIILILILVILIIGCAKQEIPTDNPTEKIEQEQKQQITNPASVYCEEQGGRLEIREGEGGQYGMCIFDDFECEEWAYYRGECSEKEERLEIPPEEIKEGVTEESVKISSPWKYGGAALSGKHADAEILELGNGKYRMYYAAEPEVPGFRGQVYSAISSDGLTWTPENGERMEWATFPSTIKLDDGKYRMYYQKSGVIKSALSSDGLSWKEESGTRIDTANNAGLNLENVAAPTVIKNGEEYLMAYRGTINEKYPEKVPNANTQLFLWATSKDGLTFEKKGMALESRTDKFKGLLDGPEFVLWDDGTIRLYFWSYKGIYHVTFSNGKFSAAEFDYTTNTDPMKQFPENPPSDPTLAKIKGKWHLYYGQHTQGIFYATLEN